MERDKVTRLHYITHIDNLSSIIDKGLLCHSEAAKVQHRSIALSDVQAKRTQIVVPNGLELHSYVNLYFDARNPMLSKVRGQHNNLVVLSVSQDSLFIKGSVIADGNASSKYTAFYPSPEGLFYLDSRKVFAEYWTSPNQIEQWENARTRCAELLVPYKVEPQYITGAIVSSKEASNRVSLISELQAEINPWFFFQSRAI